MKRKKREKKEKKKEKVFLKSLPVFTGRTYPCGDIIRCESVVYSNDGE